MKKSIHPSAISKTFCILPWIHLSTRPNGHLRLCCTANASSAGATNDKKYGGEVGILKNADGKPANLNIHDLNSAWNNEFMKSTRLKMLNGEVPASCSKCFVEEKAGHRSKREWETEYWSSRIDVEKLLADTQDDGAVPPQIKYVDLRLGTKCNLKCVMCSPHDSSKWIPDWNAIYPDVKNPALKETMQWPNQGRVDGASYNWHINNLNFWEQLYAQLPNMEQLYFAGGEPLIIEQHYALLEECIKRGVAHKIELRYNSNGIEIPPKVFDLWSCFKRVRFHFSIDSIYEMNHYIRYPSVFSEVERNLEILDQSGVNIEVTIACAVQVLNILYLPEMIKWKLERNFKKINPMPLGAGLLNFHLVYHPPHLNVKILPPSAKQYITKKFEKFYIWLEKNHSSEPEFLNSEYGIKRLKGMINFMNSADWSNRMPEFMEYISLIDKQRSLSFKDTFPELYSIVVDYES